MRLIIIIITVISLGCFQNYREKVSELEHSNINKKDSSIQINNSLNIIKKKSDTIYSFNNAKNISNKLNQIIPDTTVNMKLKLSNLLSLQQFFSGYKDDQNLIIGLRESPIAIFFNKSKLEYLFAYQYEGSSKNTFDCFEIGYLKNESRLNNVNYYNTSIDSFLTESNLGLGITLDKLESIKGTNYIKTNYADLTKIIYRNSDFDNTAFLKRYSMPSYFMEFTLKENKVIMLKYGFDYP